MLLTISLNLVVRSEKEIFNDSYDTSLAEDCMDLCGYLCESYDDVSAIRDIFVSGKTELFMQKVIDIRVL